MDGQRIVDRPVTFRDCLNVQKAVPFTPCQVFGCLTDAWKGWYGLEMENEEMDAYVARLSDAMSDNLKTLIVMSRAVRTLAYNERPYEEARPFMEGIIDFVRSMPPSITTGVIMELIREVDDWKPSTPVQEVKPDYSDPGVAETFRKIDEFLADPSTGVRRERPAPRITGQS